MARTTTLLVVDDDQILREIICDFVQYLRPDWNAVSANNGREGLELAQSLHPDLILTDLNMPVMNGYQMALALKDQPETHNIPLILCTSEDLCRAVGVVRAIEWSSILFKPTLFGDLDAALDRALPSH